MSDNNFFNFFSPDTKKVLLNCQKIAHDSKTIIGTDHLLLALLITPNTKTHIILSQLIKHQNGFGMVLKVKDYQEESDNSRVSKPFKQILKIAADFKTTHQKSHIEPEDLLFAIIQHKNCIAYKILKKLKIDIDKLEEITLTSLLEKNNHLNPDDPMSNIDIFSSFENPSASNPFQQPNAQFFISNPHKNPKNNSYLDEFGIDLTKLAKENKLDRIITRDQEVNRLMQILCRRQKNNPVLVGDPGVGKTAIVEGLAQKIIQKDVPEKLIDKKIIMLDLAMIVAGTMYRGQYEDRIKKIIKEVKNNQNTILFIDEIHTMIGSGSAEGSMDTANMLKPALSRGDIRLIGATTHEEFRKFIEKDPALERRLQKIKINEPDHKYCKNILNTVKKNLESFHHIKITDDAIDASIYMSNRFITDKFLPDKAIDLLDEASASIHLTHKNPTNQKIIKLKLLLKNILEQKEKAIEKEDFPQAAYLRSREIKINENIKKLSQSINQLSNDRIVDKYKIAETIANITHIPYENIIKSDSFNVSNLSKKLSQSIVGQKDAIKNICETIVRSKAKLSDPNRPLGSFIFLGPTGVGKTEIVKTLSKTLFGSEKKLIKLDMSEFMEKHHSSRLVGAPPGYVGYDDAGKLTEAVKNNPYSIVLFDEIEKADPEVFNMLLQILEDGNLTDAKGQKINFKNTIIVMTSNIGVSEFNKQASIGFDTAEKIDSFKTLKEKIFDKLKKNFKPEFINRLDNIVIFNPLDKKAILAIVKIHIKEITKRIKDQNIAFTIDEKAISYLARLSYNPEYGAREVRRVIDKHITNPVANIITKNSNVKIVKAKLYKNNIIFDIK